MQRSFVDARAGEFGRVSETGTRLATAQAINNNNSDNKAELVGSQTHTLAHQEGRRERESRARAE